MSHFIKSLFSEQNLKSTSSSALKEIGEIVKQIQIRKSDN